MAAQDTATIEPFGLAEDIYSRATGKRLGVVVGYEENGDVQVLAYDADPFDTPAIYRVADLTDEAPPAAPRHFAPIVAPTLVPGVKQATKRAHNLQAGTVTITNPAAASPDDRPLALYYSYGTLIGGMVEGEAPIFTDAYYSVRTEAHAAHFGIRADGAIVLPDPDFRRAVLAACQRRGLPSIPRADFTRSDRETSFPDSPFFHEKRLRGQNPRTGSYVYVVRDRSDPAGCDATGHGYRVKATYSGLVKADDPDKGWKKGQRMIRPMYTGFGQPTEAVNSELCETEGGAPSFTE